MIKIKALILIVLTILLLQPLGGRWAWLINLRWLYVFVLAFFISALCTDFAIGIAHRFNLLDYPDERKKHSNPTPRIGGIAVFFAVVIAVVRNLQFSKELTHLLIGASLIYALGLLDDIKPQKAALRLFVQLAAAFIVVVGGVRITAVPHLPFELLIEYVITIIWLIGIANALNFLDGINGLAAGMAAICSLLFFAASGPEPQTYLSYAIMALAGGCAGFLPKNMKGKIFLGDAGATFIGFFLAGLAVMGTWAEKNPLVAVSTPLLILSIPIFDMIYTTVSRIKNGSVKTFKEWLEYTGRDHLHHRLLKMGFNDISTLFFILLLNLMLGLGAMTIKHAGSLGSIYLLSQTTLIFILIVMLMLAGRETT